MNDEEKIEEALKEIKKLIEHYKKNVNVLTQQPINDLEKIRKILEYVDRSDDGWIPGVVGERTDSKGNKY